MLYVYTQKTYCSIMLLYIGNFSSYIYPAVSNILLMGRGEGGAKFDCYSSNNFSEFLLLRRLLNLKFNVKCTGIKLFCLINKDEQLLFGDRPLSSLITICMLFNDSLVCMWPMHEFVFLLTK